jgi:Type VI secretion system (T6SS), amidase immunity protein
MDTKMKLIWVIFTCIALPFFTANNALASGSAIQSYSQTLLLKNWVLSRCLAKAYPSKQAKTDAQLSASGYLEFGNVPIEAYDEGELLVDQYLKRTYSGVIKNSYNTMKCIDLFHSKALEALTQKYTANIKPPLHN